MARPKTIGNIVAELMARRGYARIQATSSFAEVWHKIAGEALARFSRVGTVKRGVLEVFVANSTILQEMTFRKAAFLKQLTEQVPEENIRDLKFRVGPIS